MDNFFEQHGFIYRLATPEEIERIAYFIALNIYTDCMGYAPGTEFNLNAAEKGIDNFIDEYKNKYINQIKGMMLVEEYSKYNIKIFTYNCIENDKDDNIIYSKTFRTMENPDTGFEDLKDEDNYFDMINYKSKSFLNPKNNAGRPKLPSEISIQKTMNIKKELYFDENLNVVDLCKQYNIAPSTYYRVNRWIVEHKLK